ncbi:MAG: RNA-protein complex protein Nop10 [Candidatus Methanomethylophilaceae archaeon]
MNSRMRRCDRCARYTLQAECPQCGEPSRNPLPPRFSPEDRYGAYRRKLLMERCGENGKYNQRPDRGA